MPRLEFLTRTGCPGSAPMEQNIRTALAARDLSLDLVMVDVGTLAREDDRTGYGTPTLLVDGRDLFGLPRPAAAAPM